MPVLVDGRPAGVDAWFRPGNTFTIDFTWPAGELAGRSFTAALAAAALDVSIVGDVLTVTASEAQTAAVTASGQFVLTETTGGGTQDIIAGTWAPSDRASTPTSLALTVATAAAQVEVSVAAAVASPAVVHNWLVDGWEPWRTQLVSDDDGGAASQSLSVVDGRGRITNTTIEGNVRIAYERLGTEWENSEVLALWYGGSIYDSTVCTPQMGQFHRGYVDDTGRWRAVVITNNIFLSDPNVVNQNVWNHDPTQSDQDALDLGSNGGGITYAAGTLGRTLQVRAVTRINFGQWLNTYVVDPTHAYGLTIGDAITVDVSDATFDQATPVAITATDPAVGALSIVVPTTLSTVAMKFEQGTVTPSATGARRWWPYWVRSRLIGTDLSVKVWRYQDPEPDWADALHVVVQDFTLEPPLDSGVCGTPEPAARMPVGVGRCGLVGAHLRNSAYMEYGQFEARQL